MFDVHVDTVGDLTVIECEGRLVRSESAFKLRQAVICQSEARVIMLDFSGVTAIEGGGLGMLLFLQRWAYDHDVRLKLFNPTQAVQDRLQRANSMPDLEVATLDEMVALMSRPVAQYATTMF
jgi:anti-anti-sigma regulatory factor